MAGDWIRMRTSLYRDPKVILISDALMDKDSELSRYVSQVTRRDCNVTRNVMRNVTVGALVTVWGVVRTQGSRDGDDAIISGATLSVIDDISDIAGFGEAMASVGWASESTQGLVFPRFFEEHNSDYESQKAKNRERQRRYREAKKRNVTVTLRNAPREEERREEKSVKGSPPTPPKGGKGSGKDFDPLSVGLPPELDCDSFRAAWKLWCDHRREIGKRLTPQATSQQLAKLATFGAADAVVKIETAVANGWQGVVFADSRGSPRQPKSTDKFAGNREFLERLKNGRDPIQPTDGATDGDGGQALLGG